MSRLSIRLLGPPRIENDDVPVALDTRKAIALLALLVINPGEHPRDKLATLLWPDSDQQHARAALRRTLSTLASGIGAGRFDATRESIRFLPANSDWIDVFEFGALLAQSRDARPGPAIEALERAVGMYDDDFLSGFSLRDSPEFDDWQAFQTERLRRELASALERVVTHHAHHGEYIRAIEHARRWLELDPLHEPAHRWLMQCYAGAGLHAAAVRQYRECVRILDQELGVAPLPETTVAYEAIREHRALAEIAPPVEHVVSDPLKPVGITRQIPIVGRDGEMERLVSVYRAIEDHGRFVVIEGEAGVGKTRLADALVEAVRGAGGVALTARCYEGESDLTYGPIVALLQAGSSIGNDWRLRAADEAVAEAARLAPELVADETGPADTQFELPGARTRFFDGCASVLEAILSDDSDVPGLLVIDDLHWADDATVEFLGWLTHRLDAHPIFLVATWRGEEIPIDGTLRRILAVGERASYAELVELGRLSRDDVGEIVDAALGESRLADRLFEETEGLPFFLIEYLTEIAERAIEADADLMMPRGVRDLLHSRVGRVGEIGRQLLSTGAVIGRSFDLDTLREASGRGEDEVVEGIETLMAAGLVTEVDVGDSQAVYDFSHERLRAFVYDETSLARRRLLHRRIADALALRSRGQAGASAVQIANHYRLAGLDAQAADQFRLAGVHARSVYAHHDGLSHFQSALALGYPDSAELHQAIGDLRTLLGDYAAARASYETALSMHRSNGEADDASLEQRIGVLCQRRGEWSRSESHFRAALAALDDGAPDHLARLFADWSLSAHNLGEDERARSLAGRALELASSINDAPALVQTWNILGVLARRRGDYEEAVRSLQSSRRIADEIGDRGARAAALNNLALLEFAAGVPARAIELAEQALVDCVETGDRHREAALLNNLADFYHALGQDDDAMEQFRRSAAIYTEIGTIDGEPHPEIWKLVEW